MRILFVKPNMGLVDGKPYYDRGRMEPLTFAVLKGFTPKEHDVSLCDDRFETVPYGEHWDVVGINTEIYTARRAYEIADRFRKQGSKVILGGFHATMIAEEALEHSDAVVLGDADSVWTQVLRDIEADTLRRTYDGIHHERLITGVQTDWTVFRNKKYLPVALTQFSRGCPNRCDYCATGNIYQGRFGHRPIREVVDELAEDGRRYVFFADDNIISNIPAAKELFRALIPLRLRWTGQASLNFTSDHELMDLMLKSGCAGLVVGFESRNADDLASMNKRTNLLYGSYDEIVERIRSVGILIWAAFLLGYDHETVSSIRETVDWALSKKFAFSAFNILMPYPSTPFYRRMKEEGRLLYDGKWWLHDDYRFGYGAFRPKNMSAETLGDLGLEARLKHNTIYQIMRRGTDRKTNSKDIWSVLTYLAYNPLFRDEMLKKHGMVLGYRGYERDTAVRSPLDYARKRIINDNVGAWLLEGSRTMMTRASKLFT